MCEGFQVAESLDAPAPGADTYEPQTHGEPIGSDDDRYGPVESKAAPPPRGRPAAASGCQAFWLGTEHDVKQEEIARELDFSQMHGSRLPRKRRQDAAPMIPAVNGLRLTH
jgi:hypothetical protein